MVHQVVHKTDYTYQYPVSLCHNIVRLIPRSTHEQFCKKSEVIISPEPDTLIEYEDFFGNKLLYFTIEKEHKQLGVHIISEIEKLFPVDLEPAVKNPITWEEVCRRPLSNSN